GRNYGAQPGHVRKQGLRALAVRLSAVDPAAGRHAYGQWGREVARTAITQARCLRHDLICGGVEVVRELDLHHRPQAVGAHTDCRADDPAFRDRRIEHAFLPILRLQAFGTPEHAAEITNVLSEDHDVLVAAQHDVHSRTQGLDHGHRRHVQSDFMYIRHIYTPNCWRLRR